MPSSLLPSGVQKIAPLAVLPLIQEAGSYLASNESPRERGGGGVVTKKASKKKSVVAHKFDFKSIYNLVKDLVSIENIKNIKQNYYSSSFLSFLNKQTPLTFDIFKVDFNGPLYRVTTFLPTSVKGSFAYGGRFNVGGSQLNKSIDIKPFAALYFSTDLQCAENEHTHGTPLGPKDIKYEFIPSKIFELWDVEKVISFLNFPNLNNLVNQGPMFNSWGYCKVPMQSQILAFWLKKIGGDGILYKSTQNLDSSCVALFAKDNEEPKGFFSSVNRIES